MTKILLTNTNCSWNKGSAAQVISTANILRKIDDNVDLTLISHFPEQDFKLCNCHNVNILGSYVLNNMIIKIFFYLICSLLIKIGLQNILSKNPIIKSYLSCDFIVDLSGDSFSDVGAFSFDITSSLIFAASFRKPLIIYSQSIGPFNRFSLHFAKFAINKADLVVVREEITGKYLKELGINTPIKTAPDCAFILESSSKKRVSEILSEEKIKIKINKSLVGVSANGLVGDENYKRILAKTIDYITGDLGAQVIFVPHVVARDEKYTDDDRLIGTKIYDLINNKDDVFLIHGDYSPNELKGIIKSCDIFIGGRMHANIAALSTNVPTLATSWSHKYKGIMGTFGLDNYVCNIRNIDFKDIKFKIDKLWNNKDKIRNDLEIKMRKQKEMTWESGKFIVNL